MAMVDERCEHTVDLEEMEGREAWRRGEPWSHRKPEPWRRGWIDAQFREGPGVASRKRQFERDTRLSPRDLKAFEDAARSMTTGDTET